MPTDFQSSRCRVSSTSRTIGLLRTSFLMAYSKASAMLFPGGNGDAFGHAELRAARPRVPLDLFLGRHDRLLGQHPHADVAGLLEGPERVLHDAVFERVKRDHDQTGAVPEPAHRRLEKPVETLELAVHPDAQRPKHPRRGVDARMAAPWNRTPHD